MFINGVPRFVEGRTLSDVTSRGRSYFGSYERFQDFLSIPTTYETCIIKARFEWPTLQQPPSPMCPEAPDVIILFPIGLFFYYESSQILFFKGQTQFSKYMFKYCRTTIDLVLFYKTYFVGPHELWLRYDTVLGYNASLFLIHCEIIHVLY